MKKYIIDRNYAVGIINSVLSTRVRKCADDIFTQKCTRVRKTEKITTKQCMGRK